MPILKIKKKNNFFRKSIDKIKNVLIFAVLVLFVFHNWAHLNERLFLGGFFICTLIINSTLLKNYSFCR